MLKAHITSEYVGNPMNAIVLYKNTLSDIENIPSRMESIIGDSTLAPFMWMDAMVGDQKKMPEYRDCVDCKLGEMHIKHLPSQFMGLKDVYNDTTTVLTECLSDYESRYNIRMDFMEAINFVRYGVGQHFGVHSDHGFSYNCTVSSVLYLNDDYEGGELWFPYMDVTFKPQKGDLVIFPSTFIYAHSSKPITSGVKYAAVTMYDYNDRTHKNYAYGKNIDGSEATYGAGIPGISTSTKRFIVD